MVDLTDAELDETGPERTCIVTRAKGSPDQMIRFVAAPDGTAALHLVGEDRRQFAGEGLVGLELRAARSAEIVGEVERGLPAALGVAPQRPHRGLGVVAELGQPVEGEPDADDDADDDRRHQKQLHQKARAGRLDGRQGIVGRDRAAG